MNLHNFDRKILDFAKKDKVVTTAEIAKHFGISWNTAERYLLFAFLVGAISGAMPAVRASKLRPVDALRYE